MSAEAIPVTTVESLREHLRMSFALCYEGDEAVTVRYGGHFYVLEPHVPLQIKDRMEVKRDHLGRPLEGRPRVVPEGGDAATIAAAVLEIWADNGVTVLYGDEFDPKRREIARAHFIRRRVEQCMTIQTSWQNRCDAVAKSGGIPPIQPPHVRAALKFLALHEGGFIDRKNFVTFDGADYDTVEEARNHIRTLHRMKAAELEAGGKSIDMLITDLSASKKASQALAHDPNRPVMVASDLAKNSSPGSPALPETDAAYLYIQAGELGVKLSRQEMVGLLQRDRDVVEAVTERLLAAAVAAQTAPKKGGAATKASKSAKGKLAKQLDGTDPDEDDEDETDE